MPIVIRDVSDDEIPRACEIEALAYADNTLGPILAPGPRPADAAQQRIQQVIDMRKEDPKVIFMQAFDEAAGKMIAFAKWVVLDSPEAAAGFSRPLSFGAGRNVEACTLFFGGSAARQKELMGGRPYLCKLSCIL